MYIYRNSTFMYNVNSLWFITAEKVLHFDQGIPEMLTKNEKRTDQSTKEIEDEQEAEEEEGDEEVCT